VISSVDSEVLRGAMSLAERVCSCETLDDVFQGMLHELTRYFEADTSCAFELSMRSGRPWLGRSSTVSMPKNVLCAYNDHYVGFDPICGSAFSTVRNYTIRANHAEVTRLSDAMDLNNPGHARYYEEFLHQERLDHVLGIMLRPSLPDTPLLVLGFQRNGAHHDFSADDVERARLILPALLSRVDIFSLRQLLGELRAADQSERPLAFELEIDQHSALSISARAGNSRMTNPSPRLFYPGMRQALQELSGSDTPAESVANVLAALGIPVGRDADRVQVSQLAAAAGTSRFVLTLRSPDRVDALHDWARHYGMTAREVDVVACVSQGLRNAEIAKSLGLSIRTIENHLRSIFGKAGVGCRTQLVHDLLVKDRRPAEDNRQLSKAAAPAAAWRRMKTSPRH